MKSLSTIAMVSVLAACSSQPSTPAPQTPPQTAQQPGAPAASPGSQPATQTIDVDANLARLRALNVFQVNGLIEAIPEEANCYNLACPGKEKEFSDAKAAAASKLAVFTDAVVKAAALPAATEDTGADAIATNLSALRALQVVSVGELIVEQPKTSPNCYGLVCPGDQEAADDANHARAGKLANIAHALAR